jgi:prephenate dehydratase
MYDCLAETKGGKERNLKHMELYELKIGHKILSKGKKETNTVLAIFSHDREAFEIVPRVSD